MKLCLIAGIGLLFCIHFSHQLPIIGTHGLKPPSTLSIREQNALKIFGNPNIGGKIWKNHGIRSAGNEEEEIGNGVGVGEGTKIDTNTVDEKEKALSKRGWLKKIKDVSKNYISVKRAAKDKAFNDNGAPNIVAKEPSTFDIGTGVHIDDNNVIDTNFNTEEKEIQKVKRGWFKKLWNNIKNVVVGSLIGLIKRDTVNGDIIEDNSDDLNNIVLSDEIIEVELGTDTVENEEEKEKEIEIVKRGWFKKIRRKIKNVLTGAVAGSLVGSIVKRESENEAENVKADLPLLLKTLRLRPGTANEITKIVEKLVNDSKIQDSIIAEIFDENEGDTVVERNGKSIRCRFVRGKFVCF